MYKMPNLLWKKKFLNAALVLLMASFLLEKFVSFPYSKEIIELLQNLAIPFMTLIINNSEGQGEPNIINDGIQGNNDNNNENANDLANEGNNEEAIPPEPANAEEQKKQLNKKYHY